MSACGGKESLLGIARLIKPATPTMVAVCIKQAARVQIPLGVRVSSHAEGKAIVIILKSMDELRNMDINDRIKYNHERHAVYNKYISADIPGAKRFLIRRILEAVDQFVVETPDWNNHEFSDGIVVGMLCGVEALDAGFDVDTFRYDELPRIEQKVVTLKDIKPTTIARWFYEDRKKRKKN